MFCCLSQVLRHGHRLRLSGVTLASLAIFWLPCWGQKEVRGNDDAPVASRWESVIQTFEEEDRKNIPPEGGVLFVGSSSIRLWDTEKHFPSFSVVNRGFGGSQISDVLEFFERVVSKYRPTVIVFYAGDNDIAAGRSADEVVESYQAFLARVGEQLSDTQVVFIPIKPSLSRWAMWPTMRDVNTRIRESSDHDSRWHYADTATPMLNGEGEPRPELFARDGLHLSDTGYQLWSEVVRSVLREIVPAEGRKTSANLSSWSDSLLFYASFDNGIDADVARGDRQAYTATEINRKEVRPGLHVPGAEIVEGGKWGNALRHGPKTEEVLFYRGAGNVPYAEQGFEGTVSLWMKLSPDKDLEPGFVDPLQITDKAWNNASFFLDFSKDERPRHFRLGVFSDYMFWNPKDIGWDDIPEAERPMVTVKQPPFTRDRWTHVAFTFQGFNQEGEAVATLYLDGRSAGSLTGPQKFTWNPDDVAIMLGIYYTGLLDELAIFDRVFSAEEIQQLSERTEPLKALFVGEN
jgi:lysophospholipase L1-like esterase